ncbi:LLM class F420-dependent oxidoreductase [Actinokineospora auranticolor]|uniref:Putative F420-dependent oxidoreductase n=1 Tax=Actinokineospora auranticolor TaxID=155976 RepID=A0A2S6GRS0_9PSEU|nr:LLM class F420-dependent oxidoreductase [Actinokineospora auranticolor]PPK67910.1 putative F420-dependent oxidoreductase [Actinokineospora auranticolor]
MAAELGRVGVWSLKHLWDDNHERAAELEELGFGTLWLGGSPGGDLTQVDDILANTRALTVGTSILNIWTDTPATAAAAQHRIVDKFPDRFVLGVGAGHKEIIEPTTGQTYERPYSKLADYLDQLDVPKHDVAIAALGPKALKLATTTRGALPYLVTPEHTAQARETLGQGPLLAPEQHVLLETDPTRARELARQALGLYLGLPNYVRNWRRLGFTDDDVRGSDHLVDSLIAWGDEDTIKTRVEEHLAAGADHVAIQVVTPDGGLDFDQYRRLAAALL